MYWINGILGTGKSTIARTIALLEEFRLFLASHIYFNRMAKSIRDLDIIYVLAYELASWSSALAGFIVLGLNKNLSTPKNRFRNLILNPLKDALASNPKLKQQRILIILDGLDEYGTYEMRASLLQLFVHEFPELPANVRFLVTSRPEGDFRVLRTQSHIIERELKHNSQAGRRDVTIYLRSELEKLLDVRDSSFNDRVERLSEAANGLFVWAVLAIELLRGRVALLTTITDLATNKQPIEKLDDMYRLSLQSTEIDWKDARTRERFALLLSFVLSKNMLLTTGEIDELLKFKEDSSTIIFDKLQWFLSGDAEKPVSIRHKSFADYLLSEIRQPSDPWYINPFRENRIISKHCFVAMQVLRFNIYQSTSKIGDEATIDGISRPVLYASLNWAEHLGKAEFSGDLLEALQVLLRERILFWFELLCYVRAFDSVASNSIINAINWISRRISVCIIFY